MDEVQVERCQDISRDTGRPWAVRGSWVRTPKIGRDPKCAKKGSVLHSYRVKISPDASPYRTSWSFPWLSLRIIAFCAPNTLGFCEVNYLIVTCQTMDKDSRNTCASRKNMQKMGSSWQTFNKVWVPLGLKICNNLAIWRTITEKQKNVFEISSYCCKIQDRALTMLYCYSNIMSLLKKMSVSWGNNKRRQENR